MKLLLSMTVLAITLSLSTNSLAKGHHHSKHCKHGWYASAGGSVGGDAGTQMNFAVEQGALNREGTLGVQENSNGLNLGVGYKFENGVRVEGSVVWIGYDLDDVEYTSFPAVGADFATENSTVSGSTDVEGALLSVYYDFDTNTKWVPYVGVGIGVGRSSADIQASVVGRKGTTTGDDTSLLLKAEAGLGYQITKRAEVSASYQLYRVSEVTFSQATSVVTSNAYLSRFGVKLKLKL